MYSAIRIDFRQEKPVVDKITEGMPQEICVAVKKQANCV